MSTMIADRVPGLPFTLTTGHRVKTAPGMADPKRWLREGSEWQMVRHQPGEDLLVFAAVEAKDVAKGLRVTAKVQIKTAGGYEWSEKSILCKSLDVQVPEWAVTKGQTDQAFVVLMSAEDYGRIASLIAEAKGCVESGRHIGE